jgi:ABC-type branched-subunit amino acid transport system ATPase component
VRAANLTLADKKRLEITRALATEPRPLLLDEAMSGLTPAETATAVELVRRIHTKLGLAICVHGREHHGEMLRPAAGHHRVGRDLLHRGQPAQRLHLAE